MDVDRSAERPWYRDRVLAALLVIGAAYFAYRWTVELARPGALNDEGWRGWVDQGFYLREAVHIAHLRIIPAGDFAYGPGYPALAAPFARIGEHGWLEDPFLPADAAIWLLSIATTYLVGRRLAGVATGAAAAIALMFASPLVNYMTLPWNTTAVLAAVDLVLLVALSSRLRPRHGVVLGVAAGLAFTSRYADVAWIGIMAASVLLARRELRMRSAVAWIALLTVVLVSAPTLYLHDRAFGSPTTTPYAVTNQAGLDSFDIGDIPSHAAQTFVSPYYFGSGQGSLTTPMLSTTFLALLSPLGLFVALRRSTRSRRVLATGFTLASVAATLFYCAYWFTSAYGLGYGAQHFFEPWIPLWILGGVLGLSSLFRWLARDQRAVRRGAHAEPASYAGPGASLR